MILRITYDNNETELHPCSCFRYYEKNPYYVIPCTWNSKLYRLINPKRNLISDLTSDDNTSLILKAKRIKSVEVVK